MWQCCFSLLLSFTLLGVCHGDFPCSFSDLVNNLNSKNAFVRPVKDSYTVTNVTIDITLYSVVSVETSLQYLSTLIWFSMEWNNEFIGWDPVVNCSIKSILTTGVALWKPDLIKHDDSPVEYFDISHNGTIESVKPLPIVSACKLNIFRFPFDSQKCNLTFGSYIHTVKDIEMSPKYNSSEVYTRSKNVFVNKGDWILLDIKVNSKLVPVNDANFSTVFYEITLKRVPVVHIITLILPACFMVFLDIVSMFIHAESGERLGFKITVVLGFAVLLLILNDMLPKSITAPVLGIFFLVCITVMILSIIGCVIVSYIMTLSKSQTVVPSWVKTWILKYLATLLCFRSLNKHGISILESETDSNNEMVNAERRNTTQISNEDSHEVKLLKELLDEILKIQEELTDSRIKQEYKSEWHVAALVIDRFILIAYLIIVTVVFAVVIAIWVS
ncbi:5-hydroxytryptamine receptor 3A-like isoform X2 [Lithobates pipiens]